MFRRLLGGTGRDQKHLIVSVTADRGLAGGFNVNSARATRNLLRRLEGEGKSVKLIAVGRKGRDYLRREFADKLIENPMKGGKKRPEFGDAELVSVRIQEMVAKGEVDVVTLVYNRFANVMSQVPTELRLVPMAPDKDKPRNDEHAEAERASYEFEAG